jgi:outer membrane receptor protein involved in Fe transport
MLVGTGETTSAAAGDFAFASVPPGRYEVWAESPGYGRASRVVEIRSGRELGVDLTLPFLPFAETVTVSATRSERKLKDSPASLDVLTREDLEDAPASALDDVLKQVPSFSLFRRTSSLVSHPTTQGVSLRGVGASGASRTLVLLDGIPQNDAFGNWVYWDNVPALALESIEIAPSGLSNLYGSSAMAGVIDIQSRPPEPLTAALQAFGGNRGTADFQGLLSHASGKWGATVGGGVFTTDGYTLVSEEDRGPVDVPASSRHASGHWRIEYTPSPGFTLYQSGRVFSEDRENGTPLQTNSTDETFLALGLRSASEGGSVFQANVYSHFDDFASTFSSVAADRRSETLSLAQAVDYGDVGGNLSWSRALGSSHSVSAGGDVRFIDAEDREDVFIPPANNVRDRLIPARQLVGGVYLQDVVSFRSAVLTLGLRADHWRNYDASQTEVVNATGVTVVTPYDDTNATRVSPRAGLIVHLDDRTSLRGSVYGGFRAPSLNELYRPFRVGNVLTQGNPALGPERLFGGELGVNYTPGPGFSVRATGFLDRISDPIANVTLSSTAALVTRQRQNLGRSRAGGVSIDLDYAPVPQVRLLGSYLFSDSRVTEFAAAPAIEGNLLPQVPRHRASLRADYKNPRFVDLALDARIESTRYDDDQNTVDLGGVFLVALRLDRRVAGAWSAFVSLDNLFDRRYAVQGTPVESLGTPFTVSAGVRWDVQGRRASAGGR